MKECLVSIVIPVYNVEKYIRECVDSIINQTYSNIEIILVDDGSKDASGEICDEYARKDDRVTVFHQSNQGVVRARKCGIEHASGEYLCFVDADDCIQEEMIEFFIGNIGTADMITTGYNYVNKQGMIIQKYDGLSEGIYQTKEEMKYFIANVMMFEHHNGSHFEYGLAPYLWNKMYRTALVKSFLNDLDEQMVYAEDNEFVIRYVLKAKSVVVTKECFYLYKYRENSAITASSNRFMYDMNKLYIVLRDVVSGHPMEKELIRQIELCILYRLKTIPSRMGFSSIAQCTRHIFPYTNLLNGKNYILYGAGAVGISYYKQIQNMDEGNLVLWVDRNWEKLMELDGVINPVESIKEVEYDCILLAVEKEELAEDIRKKLLEMGVQPEKIWWKKPILLMA